LADAQERFTFWQELGAVGTQLARSTKYRMIYLNMGHGGKIYSDATQSELFKNAILWLANQK
jgi:type 1 glutamine amidotransferase